MTERVYTLNGIYDVGGITWRQIGTISLLSNGIFQGDFRNYRYASFLDGKGRLIGRRYETNGSIGFLKIPPKPDNVIVLWYARPRTNQDDLLEGVYTGVWGSFEVDETETLSKLRMSGDNAFLEGMTLGEFDKRIIGVRGELFKKVEENLTRANKTGWLRIKSED